MLGKDCFKIVKKLKLRPTPFLALVKTADDTEHTVKKAVNVEYTCVGKTKSVPTLLCPTLNCNLVLGYDFWKIFGI